MRRILPFLAVGIVLALAGLPAKATSLTVYYGDLHAHTGYSDGLPGTRPAEQFAAAHANGLDFAFVTEHSEAFNVPFTLSDGCLPTNELACAAYGPVEGFTKWDEVATQAAASTSSSFLAMRGFEWTSDTQGHINAFFTRNFTDRFRSPEPITAALYEWLGRSPDLGGGGDGIAIFNHPGDKKVQGFNDAGIHYWDNLKFDPAADASMVAMDLFNGSKKGTQYESFYRLALANGWHIGAVGVSDTHSIDSGAAKWARTGVWASALTPLAIREAMAARRVFATTDGDSRVTLSASGGATGTMGERLAATGAVTITAHAEDAGSVTSITLAGPSGDFLTCNGPAAVLDCSGLVAVVGGETWAYARVLTDGGMMYSSPIWIHAA